METQANYGKTGDDVILSVVFEKVQSGNNIHIKTHIRGKIEALNIPDNELQNLINETIEQLLDALQNYRFKRVMKIFQEKVERSQEFTDEDIAAMDNEEKIIVKAIIDLTKKEGWWKDQQSPKATGNDHEIL